MTTYTVILGNVSPNCGRFNLYLDVNTERLM